MPGIIKVWIIVVCIVSNTEFKHIFGNRLKNKLYVLSKGVKDQIDI